MTAIWWMRRDLRLNDNAALHHALSMGVPIVPVFVADPAVLKVHNMGAARVTFCFESVRALDKRLREAKAGYVVMRQGDPLAVLKQVAQEVDAKAVVFNRDYSALARARDERVTTGLEAEGLTVLNFKDLVVWEESEILNQSGLPYRVFTAYLRQWRSLTPPPTLGAAYPDIPDLQTPAKIKSDDLPSLESLGLPPPNEVQAAGEDAAHAQLATWFDLRLPASVSNYGIQRNIPANDEGTSRLSPHIRFGTVGIRTLYALAEAAKERTTIAERRDSIDIWLGELAWRDFYYQLLFHFPRIRREAFVEKYNRLRWSSSRSDFKAWQEGMTGFPYIDAAMRQLKESGFMHNRTRMATAGFLIKDLLIDWRDGYDHFMRCLTDGDPANNNGGWQWAASTGASAQPYFRVFNPISQGKKHDPQGDYVRRWMAELRNVPNAFIHEPWLMSAEEQAAAGCIIGKDYPAPLVDHEEQRDIAKQRYREV